MLHSEKHCSIVLSNEIRLFCSMEEELDKLKETLGICELHYKRMIFAWENIEKYFPLNEEAFGAIDPFQMALFDQFIYRFSKLQDSMGKRLFRQILDLLQEETEGLPFIDILNKLEKLHLIDDAKTWIALRHTRNAISHEYPLFREIQIQELNQLPQQVQKLVGIWLHQSKYCHTKFSARHI